jgi:hypothetical protein
MLADDHFCLLPAGPIELPEVLGNNIDCTGIK